LVVFREDRKCGKRSQGRRAVVREKVAMRLLGVDKAAMEGEDVVFSLSLVGEERRN
jgi:hypothetical protein